MPKCRTCGKETIRKGSKYCSLKCYSDFAKGKKLKEIFEAKYFIEKACVVCNTKFFSMQTKQICCSKKCVQENWLKTHKDYFPEYGKEYRKNHQEDIKRWKRNFNKKHPNYSIEYGKKYRKKINLTETMLSTTKDGRPIQYKNIVKRPKPKDNKCEICQGKLEIGYAYHHWKIIKNIVYGIWVDRKCHTIIEINEQEKAKQIYKKYLEMKKQITYELEEKIFT